MRRYKTYKKKHSIKRKNLTIRRKKGGLNEYAIRRINLRNQIRHIMNIINDRDVLNNTNAINYINELRGLKEEADILDAMFNNNEMQDMIDESIYRIRILFGLANNNNNNNQTVIMTPAKRIRNNNNSSNNNFMN